MASSVRAVTALGLATLVIPISTGIAIAAPVATLSDDSAGTSRNASQIIATAPRQGDNSAVRKPKSKTSLRVIVSDRRGVPGRVRISGPNFDRVVTKTTKLASLRPGKYQVNAAAVKHRGIGMREPVQQHQWVLVRKGRTSTTEVSYASVRAARTKVLRSNQVVDFTRTRRAAGNVDANFSLRLRGKHRVGDIIGAGKVKAAPHGFLVKLTAKQGHRNGVTRFKARQASLPEAYKEGRLETRWARDSSSLRGLNPRATLWNRSLNFSQSYGCLTGTAGATGAVNSTANLDVSASWTQTDGISVTVAGDASASANATLSGSLTEDCGFAKTAIGPEYAFTSFWVHVGILPIEIKPEMQLYLAGTSDITEALNISGTADVDASFSATESSKNGFSYTAAPPKPTWSFNDPSFTVTGSAGLMVSAQFSFLAYGFVGAQATLGFGPSVDVTSDAPPTWALDGTVQVSLGSSGKGIFKKLGAFDRQFVNKTFPIYTHG